MVYSANKCKSILVLLASM